MSGRRKSKGRRSDVVDTWEDMEHDEVDEFHEQRDKILLEKANSGSIERDEIEASDEEVLRVHEADDSENELDEQSDQDDSDDEDEYQDLVPQISSSKKSKPKKTSKLSAKIDNDEDDDDDWRNIKDKYVEQDELAGWGQSSKSYYNADDIEDEEDAKEEEQAALKIQSKQLASMSASDFVDDFVEDEEFVQDGEFVKETLPTQDLSKLSTEEKLKVLQSQNPELIPLSKEYSELSELFKTFSESQISVQDGKHSVKFIALSSYLACLSAYFTIFCDPKFDEDTIRDNKVMNHLLVLRRYWKKLSELPDGAILADSTPELIQDDDDEDNDEEEEEEKDVSFGAQLQSAPGSKVKRKRSVERTVSLDTNGVDELDLEISAAPLSKKKKLRQSTSDYVDDAELDEVDLTDKISKRRSLRFYTSKIDQKANIRKERFSGDVDLPYKERNKERQLRLNQLAEQKGQTKAVEGDSDFLDGEDYDDNDFTASRESQNNESKDNDDDDDDYYDMVKSAKDKKRAEIVGLKDEVKKAVREGRLAQLQESVGEDGKRAINYQILKNKGLTPKRNKDNRNARVKKRKKYEKAKKKLASIKQVYKTPEGPYQGEKTGIKKNLTKSVKFK
ncbi:Sas10 C-terminal domain-containing protein [Lipomyces japonicus]|uniref:Sas10 C-terminal domain-containing protein n=1 Tax=Lipomyces japonicus TaxID=56871 RepID=UPI0034CD036A